MSSYDTLLNTFLLGKQNNIQSLKLEGNNINDNVAKTLCETLIPNLTLIELSMAKNRITDDASEPLAQLITLTPCLRSLNISWNKFKYKGAV
jgi:hypothetical protein